MEYKIELWQYQLDTLQFSGLIQHIWYSEAIGQSSIKYALTIQTT
jgi:hypothetical protein